MIAIDKYEQVKDGEWYGPIRHRGFCDQCCACGLVHVVDFKVKPDGIYFRARQDARATAAVRRGKKRK
jgi:hypothetical protein